ncbi:hypothetical protein [Nocardia violaceofusca]|uniref:hypothetical protein n=1 Tax=Nocardia violaceofusca TaxID=941182 RepID=UPI0007A52253|nr:hypothetical protein [Nocardia violaceofusca]
MKRGLVTESHVVIYCDSCGDLYTDRAGEAVCFTSTHQAAYYLAGGRNGWLYDGDRITCDGCAITAECDLRGHLFPSTNDLRRCDRCGAPDDEQENLK